MAIYMMVYYNILSACQVLIQSRKHTHKYMIEMGFQLVTEAIQSVKQHDCICYHAD